MSNDDFYNSCAEILNTTCSSGKFPYRKRTRWNNRKAGAGRFENFGIIRVFNDNLVHVSSKKLVFVGTKQEVLERLKEIGG